jgi:hypothetical protein
MITPGRASGVRDRVTVWADAFVRSPHWSIGQGSSRLWSATNRPAVIPNRPIYLPGDWMRHVDPQGPAVEIAVTG